MRKNENPNSTNVRPKGTSWKLGSFFLWVCILFSNPLLAAEEIHAADIADSLRSDQDPKAEVNVLYIEKGAFVYGMENVTQTYASPSGIPKSSKKATPKLLPRKQKAIPKKTVIPKAEEQLPKPDRFVGISSHPSEDFFSRGKQTSSVATVTQSQTLKSALPANRTQLLVASYLNTNSLYTYSFSVIRDVLGSRILTRPPPSLF